MATTVSTGQLTIVDTNDGQSVAEISVYARKASTPNTPTGGAYNFTTQVLTVPTSADVTWYSSPDGTSGTDTLYISRARATYDPTKGTTTLTLWTTPVQLSGSDGSNAVAANNNNYVHQLSAYANGEVKSYVGSGTTISVVDGGTGLTWVAAATTLTNGTFKITGTTLNPVNSITVPAITSATVGDLSGMTADTVSITYNISYLTTKGVAGTISTVQTIDKKRDTPGATISATNSSFSYPSGGTGPTPASSTVTATSFGVSSTPHYEFFVGASSVQAKSTTTTYPYTPNNSYSSMPQTVTVKVYPDAGSTTVLAQASIAMNATKAGEDSVLVDLNSESDVISADSNGFGYILPLNNAIKLYKGGVLLTSNVTYGPVTTTKNGLTASVDSSTGNISFSGSSWISDTEDFNFTATYNSVVYTATYTISKSKAGSNATLIDLVYDADVVYADTNGANYTLPTGNSIKLYKGGTQITSGITYGPASTVKNGGLTATVNTSTGAITLSGASWTSDRESFTFTAEYTDVVLISLVYRSEVVNTLSNGTGYSLPTGNSIRLHRGGVLLSSGVTYGPSSITKNGLTATVNASTGAITLSGGSWTTDTENFDFTATYSGVTYTTRYSITKSKQTTTSVFIDLVNESNVITALSDGTGYTLPTGNSIRLYSSGAQVSSGVTYGPSSTVKNGLTATVNTSTGGITLTGASWTTDTESFDFTATYNSVTYYITYTVTKSKNNIYSIGYSISKSKTGATGGTGPTGPTGATAVKAYIRLDNPTLPSAPSITAGTIPTSGAVSSPNVWYSAPPSGNLAEGQWLFQVDGTLSGTTYTWNNPSYLSTFKVGALTAISAKIGTFQTTESGQGSVKITDTGIVIYDSSGVARVKIGNLSLT